MDNTPDVGLARINSLVQRLRTEAMFWRFRAQQQDCDPCGSMARPSELEEQARLVEKDAGGLDRDHYLAWLRVWTTFEC